MNTTIRPRSKEGISWRRNTDERQARIPPARQMTANHSARHKVSGTADHREPAAPATMPDQALQRLMEGNRRFTSGKMRHSQISQERLASLTSHQAPFAAILGCSDSRVPPELVFDQGFGDLFVLRLAGN